MFCLAPGSPYSSKFQVKSIFYGPESLIGILWGHTHGDVIIVREFLCGHNIGGFNLHMVIHVPLDLIQKRRVKMIYSIFF